CRVAVRGHGSARRVKSGGAAALQMNGFSATASMASTRGYSSLVPDPLRCKKMLFYNHLYERLRHFGLTPPARKICTRSIVVRRTIIEHAAQKVPINNTNCARDRSAAPMLRKICTCC
ncbi:MAG: hypothetical protein WA773_01455, partial [Bradyrhizobium sp.]